MNSPQPLCECGSRNIMRVTVIEHTQVQPGEFVDGGDGFAYWAGGTGDAAWKPNGVSGRWYVCGTCNGAVVPPENYNGSLEDGE
jgi:hypothetical protein